MRRRQIKRHRLFTVRKKPRGNDDGWDLLDPDDPFDIDDMRELCVGYGSDSDKK